MGEKDQRLTLDRCFWSWEQRGGGNRPFLLPRLRLCLYGGKMMPKKSSLPTLITLLVPMKKSNWDFSYTLKDVQYVCQYRSPPPHPLCGSFTTLHFFLFGSWQSTVVIIWAARVLYHLNLITFYFWPVFFNLQMHKIIYKTDCEIAWKINSHHQNT